MIKILIGGSPCTHWSIAQKKDRETQPNSGLGWELFLNYKIALDKYKPDYFLYENNKSASPAIKSEIARLLGVTERTIFDEDNGVRMTHINSALVSAQNRERFYVTNFGDIEQPKDRGILLKDVLDNGCAWKEKSNCIDANYQKGGNLSNLKKQSGARFACAEPIGTTKDGKAYCMTAGYSNGSGENIGNYVAHTLEKGCKSMCAEPLNTTTDRKAQTIKAQYQNTSVCNVCCYHSTYGASGVAEPLCVSQRGRYSDTGNRSKKGQGNIVQHYEARPDGKTNALTTVQKDNGVAEPHRIGCMPSPDGEIKNAQAMRIFDIDGKSVTQNANGGGAGGKGGLYAMEVCKCNRCCFAIAVEWDENGIPTKARSGADGKIFTVYEVKNGKITIKGKEYPIKLKDGFYIIRKLTVSECKRLQTIPDWYEFPVSPSQAYKQIGNGWTIEVIKYLLRHIPNIENEEIEVLSMYDDMSCGMIAFKEMGCNVVRYFASEIDKYAMQSSAHNFPEIIQIGDAFQVREDDFIDKLEKLRSENAITR